MVHPCRSCGVKAGYDTKLSGILGGPPGYPGGL